jgi:hypothetical protein
LVKKVITVISQSVRVPSFTAVTSVGLVMPPYLETVWYLSNFLCSASTLSVSAEGIISIESEMIYKIHFKTNKWQQVTQRTVIKASGCTRGIRRVLLENMEKFGR